MEEIIIFKPNGFIDCYTGAFIAYQGILSIDYIKQIRDDDTYNLRLGLCTEENAYSRLQYGFTITLKNNKNISIGFVYNVKLYECIPRKNKLLKWLYGDRYIKNKQLDKFYSEETEQMKKDMILLKKVREELIEHFNEWKNE